MSNWDEIQHIPVSEPPEDFDGLAVEEAVETIKEWFFDNFEDPAESTPYESAEGGYQYIWGGPHSAQDILYDAFSGFAPIEAIEEALAEIQVNGFDWVPNSKRRLPPEEDEDESLDSDLSQIRRIKFDISKEIDELQSILLFLPTSTPGTGHNNPPERLDTTPLSKSDVDILNQSLIEIKSAPLEPADGGIQASQNGEKIRSIGQKIVNWIGGKAEIFANEASKEAGKQFGKWTPGALFLLAAEKIFSISSLIEKWLSLV
jgi:hypothetical protein